MLTGDLVKYDGRTWRVGLINSSRVRLDAQIGSDTVNLSPGAVLEPAIRFSVTSTHAEGEAVMTEALLEAPATPRRLLGKVPPKNEARPLGTAKPAAPPKAAIAQPAISANKVANKQRVADLADKKAARPKAAPKADAPLRPCACGCGDQVTAYFAQGHDARFKALMVKVERGALAVKDLPPAMQKQEFVKRGQGYVTKTNYKGEKHTGYDKPKMDAA